MEIKQGVKQLILLFIITLLFATIGFAQTPADSITTNYEAGTTYSFATTGFGSGTYSDATTYTSFFSETANNNLVVDSVTFSFGTVSPVIQADNVRIRRNDNPQVSGIIEQLWFERESSSDDDRYFYPEFVDTIESAFNSNVINRGADNLFENDSGASESDNNIERADYIFNPGIASPETNITGFVIFERGGNDNFYIAAITGLDGSGDPTSFGALVNVAAADFGDTGLTYDTTVFKDVDDTGTSNLKPRTDVDGQNLHAVHISLSELGISAGQTFYGFSLFGNDVNTGGDLIDWTSAAYPTDTGSADGGLDAVSGAYLFSGTSADLALTKEVDISEQYFGKTVNFTLTLTNNGPDSATGVEITDALPSGYNFEASSASQGTYDSGSGIWAVGSINNGDTATLSIEATLNSDGDYRNVAQVTASNVIDPNSTPNNDDGDQSENDEDWAEVIPLGVIPTLSEWGMIMFAFLLVSFAVWYMRKQSYDNMA